MLMQFRGREMAHRDLGLEKFKSILAMIVEASGATVEANPKFMGNRVIAMIAPQKKK